MSRILSLVAGALAWLGRYGTQGFALSIVLGLALPQFAAAARPLLPVTIFCFSTVVFLRLDISITLGLLRQPTRLAIATLWLLVAPAAIVGLILLVIGRAELDPGIVLGLAILGAAAPIMSCPAVAILYGFEPSLIIASVVIGTLLTPLVSPFLVELLAGTAVPLDRSVLMLRLLFFIGGSLVLAAILRRVVGMARIKAMKANFDGFGVLMYFIFAVAAMDGVTQAAMERPALVAFVLACVFAVSAIGLVSAWVALRIFPESERFMIGYGSGHRNMGLLIAALGAGVPPSAFLFFALAQFPIYLLPWALGGIAARIRRREALAAA